MKKLFKSIFYITTVLSVAVFSLIAYTGKEIESEYFVSDISKLNINCSMPIEIDADNEIINKVDAKVTKKALYDVEIKLLGIIPVTNTRVNITEAKMVDVLGTPFGIKIYTDGVLVIGLNDFKHNEVNVCPARESGIKTGDYILSINGLYVYSNDDVQKIVSAKKTNPLKVVYSRNGKNNTTTIYPKISDKDGNYHIGAWVRDSSAGIGTLTFYDNETNVVAGLGHGICDSDTGKLLSVNLGSIVPAEIISINKSDSKATGELRGRFINTEYTKQILNSNCGIYGYSDKEYSKFETLEMANHCEITTKDKAYILTTVSGTTPKLYECKIIEIKQGGKTKNLVIEVTDAELINTTGGIVQGMSGSPLIQNGKLVGAVTHVLVDDPTKGYGIFAETMLETAQNVAENNKLKDAS